MKHNILLTGANGQLGRSIQNFHSLNHCQNFLLHCTDIDTLDITNYESIKSYVKKFNINCIINTAAYTAVERAESEPDRAFLLNEIAVSNLAQISVESDIFLVHISTDYVFDGNSTLPYKPEDIPNPVSVYGKSKLAGEKAILSSGCRAVIIRTSWLYSEFGNNFVKTIIKNSKEKESLRVVNDQIGSPTYAGDLAEVIFKVIDKKRRSEGVVFYHFANEGVLSWYDFALEIITLTKSDCKIIPVSSREYPSKVQRPACSVFNLSKIKNELEIEIPNWKESLKKCLQSIL